MKSALPRPSKQFVRPRHCTAITTQCAALDVDSRYSYPGMIYIYPEKLDPHRLQSSLAQVLDDYPQYAGKLCVHGVRLEIRHGRGAVRFEYARSRESVRTWVSDTRARQSRLLEPRASMLKIAATREAPMMVRLTEARDGCALAVGWNHAIGDMHSTMLLMRAWAAAYRGRAYEKPVTVTDRDAYLRAVMPNPSEACSAFQRSSWSGAIAYRWGFLRRATRVSVEYSWSQLAQLRRTLSTHGYVSVNDALCAHIASVLRRISGVTESTKLCLVVNYRKRLGLSERIIGNMLSLLVHPIDEEDAPARVARGIRGALDEYADKHVDYHATMRVLDANTRLSERLRMVSRQFRPGVGDLFVTNWNNFGAYELSFGDAQPLLFHPTILGVASLPPGIMIIYESTRARGLAVTLGLSPAIAERWLSTEGQALLFPRSLSEPSAAVNWPANVHHDSEAAPVRDASSAASA